MSRELRNKLPNFLFFKNLLIYLGEKNPLFFYIMNGSVI